MSTGLPPVAAEGALPSTAVSNFQPVSADAPLRLLTVHAHPDDEALKGASTVARYHAEGVRTVLVGDGWPIFHRGQEALKALVAQLR